MGEDMDREERVKLIHALVSASNAFHKELEKQGYRVSYGLDNSKTGIIIKTDAPTHENWSLGDLTISWNINKQ